MCAAGFSGIAATIWDEESLILMPCKLKGGVLLGATKRKYSTIVWLLILIAESASAKLCSNGLMILFSDIFRACFKVLGIKRDICWGLS